MSKKNSNDTIGNRTRDLPACSYRVPPSTTCSVFKIRYPASTSCFFFSFLALWIIVICCLQSPVFIHSLETYKYMAISLHAVIFLYMQVYTDLTFAAFLRKLLFKVACKIQVLSSSSVLSVYFQFLYCIYDLLTALQYILHMVYFYTFRLFEHNSTKCHVNSYSFKTV
jgi:hypothetical protein